MSRTICTCMLLSILATSCKPAGTTSEVRGLIGREGGAVVGHASGLIVTVPQEGLYEDMELRIKQVEQPEDADTQTFFLPSDAVFELTTSGESVFRKPVEIGIPYDPDLLPDNRSEDDIFPVFFRDGTWFRTEGSVDEDTNVLYVYTLHNGLWSWAVDPIVENWPAGPKHDFFCEQGQDPETLAKAQALMNDRNDELRRILDDAKFRVEETQAPTDEIIRFATTLLGRGFAEAWSISHGSAVASQVGGKAAVVYIEGTKVGSWIIGGLESGLTLYIYGLGSLVIYKEAYAIGSVSRQIYRIDQAYKRWKEAEALVKVLENGCTVSNLPPDLAEALDRYVAAVGVDETTGMPTRLDLSVSAYEDPRDVEIEVAEAGLTDFDVALRQAMLAAETGFARDWYPLMDPSLEEEGRKQDARELAKLLEPYSLSCLSYHRGAVGNFTDGALLIFKAESASGHRIYRFTIGSPPGSSIYRYASYFETWQNWDDAYWESVKGQGTACPSSEQHVSGSEGQASEDEREIDFTSLCPPPVYQTGDRIYLEMTGGSSEPNYSSESTFFIPHAGGYVLVLDGPECIEDKGGLENWWLVETERERERGWIRRDLGGIIKTPGQLDPSTVDCGSEAECTVNLQWFEPDWHVPAAESEVIVIDPLSNDEVMRSTFAVVAPGETRTESITIPRGAWFIVVRILWPDGSIGAADGIGLLVDDQ